MLTLMDEYSRECWRSEVQRELARRSSRTWESSLSREEHPISDPTTAASSRLFENG